MIKKLRTRAYNASEKMANKVVKLTAMFVELNSPPPEGLIPTPITLSVSLSY